MNARALIPLIVVALAAFFGYSQYQSCAITLPGLPDPAQCRITPGGQPSTPTINPSTPNTTPTTSTKPDPTPTTPSTTPSTPSTAPSSPPTIGGYIEASLTKPSTNPAENLRPDRAVIMEAFNNKNYPETLSLAGAWLNARPTDALIALVRSNALARQINQPVITIGLSVPTSGKTVQAGEAILQGVNMAVQEANQAGGVRNKRVVVEILNDQNDRSLAVQAASSFVGNSAILGVIGPVNSSAALAAADIYNTGLIHVAPSAVNDALGNVGPWTYRLFPTANTQGKALAKIAKARGFTRMPVYFDPKDAYSKGLADAFVRDAATQNISAVPFEFPKDGLPDQAGIDTFADSPAPDAVFISGTHLDVARIAKALSEAGHKLPLLTGSAAYSQELLTVGGTAIEGLEMLTTFHASMDLENSKSFTKAFQARYGGGTPNARAAQAYDSTRALLEAIKRAKTVDRAGVKAALEGFAANPPAGVTSRLVFNKGGIVGRPLVIIEVKNGKLVATGIAQ
jgi:branched-chain amino acid transport system substrate-binding protein